MHNSHIGGPLIWPSDEPWPACDRTVQVQAAPFGQPGWLTMKDRAPESPVPMVGVAQFYARDIPEIPFPEGADLLQVVFGRYAALTIFLCPRSTGQGYRLTIQ
ncbi:hypothetical protein [Nonomuraea basaltis]|uniref:hypothetical protein n=1 Tax=Nonomuraea basaltis TaxID=2495887 RepID=UPI001486F0B7|nr:hypothetical protein [Nonomuraea basaltis]